jgi:hypothetical protein
MDLQYSPPPPLDWQQPDAPPAPPPPMASTVMFAPLVVACQADWVLVQNSRC